MRSTSRPAKLKVAIVCDWLTGIGGAERVVLELHKLFPEAPIYTSQYDSKALPWFKTADVHTSWLQKLPKSFKKFLPVLRAWTFSRLDLSTYDLVISSSGAEAKGIKTSSKTVHICYCHAPTHYYWSRYEEYLQHPGFGLLDPLARLGLKVLVGPMRRWDYKAAQRPEVMIANSTHTQAQIKKYYNRDSVVIHPPVDTERFKEKNIENRTGNRRGFVVAGRQTPYKRIDLAIAACTQLNLELTVIGNGPDHQKLVSMAGPTISFATNASDAAVAKYFAGARAFIFPGVDDFGIVAVEAMAAGTPVIAFKAGGALDYITSKVGLFFEQQTSNSLADVLQHVNDKNFHSQEVIQQAELFRPEVFQHKLLNLVNTNFKERK